MVHFQFHDTPLVAGAWSWSTEGHAKTMDILIKASSDSLDEKDIVTTLIPKSETLPRLFPVDLNSEIV